MLFLPKRMLLLFLGIPVDGYKHEMKQKLIDKGFVYNKEDDNFDGEFNGTNVTVYIGTNNNKVWRIMLVDKNNIDETSIKIRFNRLCSQFVNNKRYRPANYTEYTIPAGEDISHEMLVNEKIYEAVFYQKANTALIDSLSIKQKAKEIVLKEYTQEQLDNPTEEEKKDIDFATEAAAVVVAYELSSMKPVWFRINELFGKYCISMYYDNEYNKANGEDL